MEIEEKIPKIIHYCWLSKDPKPEKIQKCIESWKQHMPDYEIICWDMDRFDINSVPFVKAACEAKKWAFAADYIRVHALYYWGGIYLDSDVMVYKRFDPFLQHQAFTGIFVNQYIFDKQIRQGNDNIVGIEAAVMGSVPKHIWFKEMLSFYDSKKFENNHNSIRKNIMTFTVADILHSKFNFKYIPIYQKLNNDIHIYPPDVFSTISDPSAIKYSTHFCANSWVEHTRPNYSIIDYIKIFIIHRIIGEKTWIKIKQYQQK